MGQSGGNNAGPGMGWRWRRLRYLTGRVRGSLAQRGWAGTVQRISAALRRRPVEDQILDVLPLDTVHPPHALPVSATPTVSVIIPMHGKLAYTLACLESICRCPPDTAFEVIVVDDASPQDPTGTLSAIGGLRLLRQAQNQGFVDSCNAGAAQAKGEYLLFLNNDTQVAPGWLDALLACMTDTPRCGIAGSRLIYPDGRLQEAGGLVFADGSTWNVGRFESANDPRYGYRREVDYVSGAALLIERALFTQVGGFDPRYAPGYYEDTDLAFAVQQAGRRVMYEPASRIIHCEGISAGRDLGAGMKQFQERHRTVFADKWAARLASQPASGQLLEPLLDRHARGRILIIDSMTPDPARDSGSLRLTAIFDILRALGWQVVFAADDGVADAAQRTQLGALGVHVLCRPWVHDPARWLRRHGSELHAVMLCRCGVADQYATLARRHAPQATLLFDTVDLQFLREQRAASLNGNRALARQAETSRRREMHLIATCDTTFVVSPHEHALLTDQLPEAHIELLSNIHTVHGRRAPAEGRRDLVFIGGFGHPPNADAVTWAAKEIMPALRTRRPGLVLHVLGDVSATVRRQLQGNGIQMHGRVADLAPYMDRCRASLAPLRFGAGVKGKVNMSMSHGLPVVATHVAAEGMQLTDGEDVLLADDSAEFVAAIERLLDDDALWLRLSEGGLQNVQRHFSRTAARDVLARVLSGTSD